MRRSKNGDRMSAVKVLETTVGGFFSGSLNKCCRDKRGLFKLRNREFTYRTSDRNNAMFPHNNTHNNSRQ